ncbi:hypothetical protein [Streptomyces sp. NBC_00503]|nr:hypothetical protein [Streptomyces sp. NBC_00503]WUD82604.1 hypothetical protein OG490_19805 [Streptomyces sp. NBC_00503]
MDVGPFHTAAQTFKLLAQEPDDGAEQRVKFACHPWRAAIIAEVRQRL